MAETDVLKEFLVALGFKIDSAQYKKFTDSVTGATFNVEKLGAATAAAVIGTTAAIAKVSEVMDKLYYVSQRTGSSVSSIMAFDYGVSQLGGSADAAQASLENLGHFIRAYPGSGQFLTQLGVAPEHVKDAAAALKDLIPILKAMPQYQGLAYANMLGMDEKTFLALTSGDLTKQIDDYNERISKAGVNAQGAAEKGSAFMKAIRGVGAEAEVVGAARDARLPVRSTVLRPEHAEYLCLGSLPCRVPVIDVHVIFLRGHLQIGPTAHTARLNLPHLGRVQRGEVRTKRLKLSLHILWVGNFKDEIPALGVHRVKYLARTGCSTSGRGIRHCAPVPGSFLRSRGQVQRTGPR